MMNDFSKYRHESKDFAKSWCRKLFLFYSVWVHASLVGQQVGIGLRN